MLGVLIFCIAGFVFAYGMFTEKKVVSITAALLAVGIFIFDSETAKTITELAPEIGGPLAGLK
ncbi:hypothetical protein [Priestia megaterium]|uniref:hypothetical protein n=1 Tax=Priestia megaterium TaxID=1404 RepID=UPI00367243D3